MADPKTPPLPPEAFSLATRVSELSAAVSFYGGPATADVADAAALAWQRTISFFNEQLRT